MLGNVRVVNAKTNWNWFESHFQFIFACNFVFIHLACVTVATLDACAPRDKPVDASGLDYVGMLLLAATDRVSFGINCRNCEWFFSLHIFASVLYLSQWFMWVSINSLSRETACAMFDRCAPVEVVNAFFSVARRDPRQCSSTSSTFFLQSLSLFGTFCLFRLYACDSLGGGILFCNYLLLIIDKKLIQIDVFCLCVCSRCALITRFPIKKLCRML